MENEFVLPSTTAESLSTFSLDCLLVTLATISLATSSFTFFRESASRSTGRFFTVTLYFTVRDPFLEQKVRTYKHLTMD